MRLEWLDDLRTHPIDWSVWNGRQNIHRSTWVTDGVLAVRRSTANASKVAFVENQEIDDLGWFKGVSGKNMTRLLDRCPDAEHPAAWLGTWRDQNDQHYVTLGDPDLASYYVARVRIAQILCSFDSAFWFEGHDKLNRPYPLRLVRDDQTVGLLMCIATDHLDMPDAIRDAFEAAG